MRPSLGLDLLTALRALPQAALHAAPQATVSAPFCAAVPAAVAPQASTARATRPAALVLQRAAWYSLLAGLALLARWRVRRTATTRPPRPKARTSS